MSDVSIKFNKFYPLQYHSDFTRPDELVSLFLSIILFFTITGIAILNVLFVKYPHKLGTHKETILKYAGVIHLNLNEEDRA